MENDSRQKEVSTEPGTSEGAHWAEVWEDPMELGTPPWRIFSDGGVRGRKVPGTASPETGVRARDHVARDGGGSPSQQTRGGPCAEGRRWRGSGTNTK